MGRNHNLYNPDYIDTQKSPSYNYTDQNYCQFLTNVAFFGFNGIS